VILTIDLPSVLVANRSQGVVVDAMFGVVVCAAAVVALVLCCRLHSSVSPTLSVQSCRLGCHMQYLAMCLHLSLSPIL
jgi:hypothetical protein